MNRCDLVTTWRASLFREGSRSKSRAWFYECFWNRFQKHEIMTSMTQDRCQMRDESGCIHEAFPLKSNGADCRGDIVYWPLKPWRLDYEQSIERNEKPPSPNSLSYNYSCVCAKIWLWSGCSCNGVRNVRVWLQQKRSWKCIRFTWEIYYQRWHQQERTGANGKRL